MSHSTINANIILQNLQKDHNTVQSSKTLNGVIISCVRDDDTNVLFLRISPPKKIKGMTSSLGYPILDLKVFDRFADEGKATLKLPKSSVQVLINNCPPFELKHFLTTLQLKSNSAVTSVEKLTMINKSKGINLANVSALDVISPLRKSDCLKLQRKKLSEHFNKIQPITPERKRPSQLNADDFSTPPKKPLLGHFTSTPNASNKENKIEKMLGKMENKDITLRKTKSLLDTSLNDSFQLDEHYDLSKEQVKVLEAVKSGANVFYTGKAGTGKTFLIKRIIGNLRPDVTVVTASTGVAANLIDGSTLHSFGGIGGVIKSLQDSVDMICKKPSLLQQWRKCKHLIIDEVSLITAEYFDHLDQIGRVLRNVHNKPFGGIQLILCGDFLQLPPVISGKDNDNKYKFVFQSKVWSEAFREVLELTVVRRQTDQMFIKMLNELRIGRCPEWVDEKLRNTSTQNIEKNGIVPTKLSTHKVDVEEMNISNLKTLKGTEVSFAATDSIPARQRTLEQLCRAETNLTLKVGAQVMLIKNIDMRLGLVNGSRGVVVKFGSLSEHQYPVVKFVSGYECTIKPEKFTVTMTDSGGNLVVTRKQLPLKLAYALSVHKSQGMTLDCVELYLSKTFEDGQAYVALSRCKSLQSIKVVNWDKSCVRANPQAMQFYRRTLASMTEFDSFS